MTLVTLTAAQGGAQPAREPGRGCCLLRAGGPVWAHSMAGDTQCWVTLGPEVTEGRGLVTLGVRGQRGPLLLLLGQEHPGARGSPGGPCLAVGSPCRGA